VAKSSLELLLAGAAGCGNSSWVEKKLAEVTGNLTEGFFGRIDGEVKPVATDQGHDDFLAWTAC
jgi:hypothetical protein